MSKEIYKELEQTPAELVKIGAETQKKIIVKIIKGRIKSCNRIGTETHKIVAINFQILLDKINTPSTKSENEQNE